MSSLDIATHMQQVAKQQMQDASEKYEEHFKKVKDLVTTCILKQFESKKVPQYVDVENINRILQESCSHSELHLFLGHDVLSELFREGLLSCIPSEFHLTGSEIKSPASKHHTYFVTPHTVSQYQENR